MFFIKLNNLNLIDPDKVTNICNELILDSTFFNVYKKKFLNILNKTLIISLIKINYSLINLNNSYFLFLYEKDLHLYKDLKINYKKIFILPSINITFEIIPIKCSDNVINFIKINKYNFIFDYYQAKIFIIKIYLCFLNYYNYNSFIKVINFIYKKKL